MDMNKGNSDEAIELDVQTKCIEDGRTQAQIAENIGITHMKDLGYDVRLVYEKREAE